MKVEKFQLSGSAQISRARSEWKPRSKEAKVRWLGRVTFTSNIYFTSRFIISLLLIFISLLMIFISVISHFYFTFHISIFSRLLFFWKHIGPKILYKMRDKETTSCLASLTHRIHFELTKNNATNKTKRVLSILTSPPRCTFCNKNNVFNIMNFWFDQKFWTGLF